MLGKFEILLVPDGARVLEPGLAVHLRLTVSLQPHMPNIVWKFLAKSLIRKLE
jgi:hypothetical protein